jgi:hypothetical protein
MTTKPVVIWQQTADWLTWAWKPILLCTSFTFTIIIIIIIIVVVVVIIIIIIIIIISSSSPSCVPHIQLFIMFTQTAYISKSKEIKILILSPLFTQGIFVLHLAFLYIPENNNNKRRRTERNCAH